MIHLKISGGLGNQMFQYATAFAQAKRTNTSVKIDLSEILIKEGKDNFTYRKFELERIFNINNYSITTNPENLITGNTFKHKLLRKLIKTDYFLEKEMFYNPEINRISKNSYLEGYFQSEKYFVEYKQDIISQFSIKAKLNEKTKETLDLINNKKTLAIHIRRGDYIANKAINSLHGTCSLDYYKKALTFFNIDDLHVYFFSDDINWVKTNFSFINQENCNFIDWNQKQDAWQDMYLMSKCDNFIIANSSFSWWGAWLSTNQCKKIIAPKKWFNDEAKNKQTFDLIPTSWILV